MLDAAFAQPLQDRPLRGLRLVPQRVIDEAALFSLSAQGRSRAQVSLISQHDEKFRLLPVSRVFRHPGRDLLRSDRLVRRAALTAACEKKRRRLSQPRRLQRRTMNKKSAATATE